MSACPWDISMDAIYALPCPKHGGPLGACPMKPFYAPGYQYEVAVAGATDVLTQKINAFPLLLAVAKAAAVADLDSFSRESLWELSCRLVDLEVDFRGWREWTP